MADSATRDVNGRKPTTVTIGLDGNLLEYVDALSSARQIAREDAVLEVLYVAAELHRIVAMPSSVPSTVTAGRRLPARNRDKGGATFRFDRLSAITAIFFAVGAIAAVIYVLLRP